MRGHTQIRELLAVYRDLGNAERREVDRHIQDCAGCAARLAANRAMDWDLAHLADPRPDGRLRRDFYDATGVRGRQGHGFDRVHDRLARIPMLAGQAVELAVLLVLVVGLGVTLRGQFRQLTLPTPTPPSAPSSVAMPVTADIRAEMANPARSEALAVAASPIPEVPLSPASPQERPASPIAVAHQGEEQPEERIAPVSLGGHSLAQGAEGQVYVVLVDDSLWKLAEKYLGDGRRWGEIVEATRTRRLADPSFASIEDPGLILPGFKLWIPAPGALPPSVPPAVSQPATTPAHAPAVGGPGGHVAFSFWNDHPNRCTYEINVIDVAACLAGPEPCQATRRIFALNNVSEPALSPDSTRLAFRGWGEPTSEDSPFLNCAPPLKAHYLANTTLDGTELRGTGGFWEDSHPDWSPDGQQILFDTGRNGDGIIRIQLISADGSNERDLRIAGQQPSWAPDGQRFVYRGCDLTGNRCGLWLALAAPVMPWEVGSNLIAPVVQDERAAHPDWSPAADQIVYQSPASGSWDLTVVSADGTGPRQLTSDPAIEGLPAWSPDGQWIAYLSDAGGNWGIWIIRADGTERHLLFAYDGGFYKIPEAVEPYGQRDWIDEQISWAR